MTQAFEEALATVYMAVESRTNEIEEAYVTVRQEHSQLEVRISNQDAMLGNLRAHLEAARKGLSEEDDLEEGPGSE